jgi:hypothetical protein
MQIDITLLAQLAAFVVAPGAIVSTVIIAARRG